jgi:hypothetical protein
VKPTWRPLFGGARRLCAVRAMLLSGKIASAFATVDSRLRGNDGVVECEGVGVTIVQEAVHPSGMWDSCVCQHPACQGERQTDDVGVVAADPLDE